MAKSDASDFNASSHFDTLSSSYDGLIGLMTGDVGRYVLDNLLPSPITTETVVHDNACGTGLVTQHLQQRAESGALSYPRMTHATDFVASVTQIMQQKATRNGWKNVDISVMDSAALTFPDNYFDLSITNFGIFFLPDPQAGADHIFRTLKPGGAALVTAWKERRSMGVITSAQLAIRPDLPPLSSPWAATWEKEETLRNVLLNAGFKQENLKIVTQRTDALADLFLHTPEKVAQLYPAATPEGWTDEDKKKLGPEILRNAKEGATPEDGTAGVFNVAYVAIAIKE